MSTRAARQRAARWLVGSALALWALASTTWPLGLDQGIFAWVGDTVLRGGLPYRDAWEVKGPAVHYLYAAALALPGPASWGVRVLDLLALAVGAFAALRLAARMAGPAAGRLSAALLVSFHASGGHWNAAQPDGLAAFAWLAAAALAARDRPERASLVAAGLLCAFATLLKPFLGLFGLLLWLDRGLRAGRAAWLRDAAPLAGGLALGLAAVLAWFAAHGGLAALVEVQLVFNPTLHPSAYRETSAALVAGVFARWLAQPWIAAALLLAAPGIALQARRRRADAWLLGGWMLLAAACVVAQNQFFPYHFAPLAVALAVAAGVGFARLREPARPRLLRSGALAAAAVLALAAAWIPAQQVWRAARPVLGLESRADYLDRFGMGSFGFATMQRIAERVRSETAQDDAILVWGFEAGIYVLAERRASTRFGFPYPLIRGGGSALEHEWLAEFEQSWWRDPPARVLRFGQALAPDLPAGNRAMLARFERWLEACYARDPALRSDRLVLWQRRGDTPECRTWERAASARDR